MGQENKKYLVIVESPNKVKTISQFLPSNYTVLPSVGHITEIKNGGTYWNTGIEPEKNFTIDYSITEDHKEVVSKLRNAVKEADIVYICSDADREGEAIAWSLVEFVKIPKNKYKRATFHEITKNAVTKALENPRDLDYDLIDAAHSRAVVDKLIGYRLSPIARNKVGAKSVGRCQSAGLKLIVDREREISNFKPVEYADMYLYFNKGESEFKAKYYGEDKAVKQPSFEHCETVKSECLAILESGGNYSVYDVVRKEKHSSPKPPFSTSTFQQEVSSKLGIGVAESMSYAQKLFEGIEIGGSHIALITYIRTDSEEIAEEFKPEIKDFIISNYGDNYYHEHKAKKNDNAQDGHEAIRPVDLSMTPTKLSKYIKDKSLCNVYEIIYKRAISSMMADTVVSETTYSVKCGTHIFNLISKEVVFDGYQKLYSYKDEKEQELSVDVLEKGEKIGKGNKCKFIIEKKQTQPPARYKESTFIKELEKTGIGRPSTFASIVGTILDKGRGYCTVEEKSIVPTQKGKDLSEFLDKSFPTVISIDYTSKLEKELDSISKGELGRLDFLNSFFNTLETSVNDMGGYGSKEPKKVDTCCPVCGSPMTYRSGKYGSFLGCTTYPSCKGVVKLK